MQGGGGAVRGGGCRVGGILPLAARQSRLRKAAQAAELARGLGVGGWVEVWGRALGGVTVRPPGPGVWPELGGQGGPWRTPASPSSTRPAF